MKKNSILKCFMSLMGAILFLSTSYAIEIGDGVDLGGQMRWRMEFDGRDFDNGTALNEMSFLRTRLNLKVTAIKDAVIYFQIQDSRNLGQFNSANLGNDNNLGVHQGYLKIENIITQDVSLKVGRFESPYGRHRLMGNVGWSNMGRSFDGIKLSHKGVSYKGNIFGLKIDERGFDIPPSHKDWKLYGIHGAFMQDRLDVFVLYDLDINKTGDNYDLARYTLGSHFVNKLPSGMGYEFDAAFQTGYAGDIDISAYMVAGDIFFEMTPPFSGGGVGFDITSGDDSGTSDKNEAFDNLYYTGHKFRGYMDYFVGSNIPPNLGDLGLMDIILRGKIEPFGLWKIDIDFHHFRTMEDHPTPGGDTSKAIGQEIDLTFKREMQKGLGFQSGISTFFASDDWRADADPAFWIYFMLTAGF